ncbi:MAG: Rab family GTPase [Pseudomonadota bacterium]
MIIRKIMLLGEMGVGKTSIVNRLVFDTFSGDYGVSIGSDIYQYKVEPSPGEQPFLFNVWDTDGSFGETIFKSVYIRGAHAAVILGDVTRKQTLETMARLAVRFEEELPGRYFCCVLNKVDLLEDGETPELPERLVSRGLPYITTSARTGANVRETFADAAASIVRRGL